MNYRSSLLIATAFCGMTFSLSTFAQTAAPASPLPTGNTAIDKYNRDYIKLTRTLMLPKNVADAFGSRIAKRYIAMQITIANRNSEYQWLITNGAIDVSRYLDSTRTSCGSPPTTLTRLLEAASAGTPTSSAVESDRAAATPPPDHYRREMEFAYGANPTFTGADLTVLRGVAEKGQVLDKRNLTFRILQGSGTIAAGLLGVTTFGPSFAPAVAVFNGPLLTAYQNIFPDQTVNQLHRLDDQAYAANTLVPKQQGKVLVVFVPTEIFLTAAETKQYFKDPNSIFTKACTDLRLLDASVNGHFVTQLDLAPVITSVSISATEMAKLATDNFKVAGVITGRFLDNAALSLTGAPKGLTIAPSGTSTAERINFELSSVTPVASNTALNVVVSKTGLASATYTLSAAYAAARPVVSAGGVSPSSLAQGESKTIEIGGTGFLPGVKVRFTDSKGLTVGDANYVSNSKLKVDIAAAADAPEGPRTFVVETTGGDSGNATLTITKSK